MTWTHHQDLTGVDDYPKKVANLDLRIIDYWTNDADVRIGFFGHGKGVAIFTYRDGATNFIFHVIRAPGQVPELVEDRTLGPICMVFIKEDHPGHLGSRYGRKEVANIKDFLPQYKDPRFPSPVAIEKVLFRPSEEHFNNSYREDSNG